MQYIQNNRVKILLLVVTAFSFSLVTAMTMTDTVTPISSNQSVTIPAMQKGEEKFFSFVIPEGTATITVRITGTTGDADLYIRRNSNPTRKMYGWKSIKSRSNESVTIRRASGGRYVASIYAYKNTGDTTLMVTNTQGDQVAPTPSSTANGTQTTPTTPSTPPVVVTPPVSVPTWTNCAKETQVCTFSGRREVRYGIPGNVITKVVEGTVPCVDASFGAPMTNYENYCSYSSVTTTAPVTAPINTSTASPTVNVTWTVCTKENGTCSFSGRREVRYGIERKFVTKVAEGSVPCVDASFGASTSAYENTCWYSSDVTTSPVTVLAISQTVTPVTPAPSTSIPGGLPTITTVSPAQGGANTRVTLSGSNLTNTSSIEFAQNGQSSGAITPSEAQSQSVTFTIPYAYAANTSAGTYQLRAVTPSGTSNSLNFTFTATTPAPAPTPTPQPAQTFKFTIAQPIVVISGPINVRGAAGTGASVLGTQSSAVQGTIIGGPTVLNGYTWWNINYTSGVDGWSADDFLAGKVVGVTPSPQPNPISSPATGGQCYARAETSEPAGTTIYNGPGVIVPSDYGCWHDTGYVVNWAGGYYGPDANFKVFSNTVRLYGMGGLEWSTTEISPGVYNWEHWDTALAKLKATGVKRVIYNLYNVPPKIHLPGDMRIIINPLHEITPGRSIGQETSGASGSLSILTAASLTADSLTGGVGDHSPPA